VLAHVAHQSGDVLTPSGSPLPRMLW